MGLINLVSNLPLAVRLFEPHPDPDKPGNSPELRSVVVPGKNHPDGAPMVTRGIDSEVFEAWKGANPNHHWHKNEHIRVVSDEVADELENGLIQFGWEPGLEGAEGSGAGLDAEKHHTEVDMTAYSDAPNDDSPRSQTIGMPQVVPGAPPMDPEGPEHASRNAKPALEPTPVHDDTYRENFKDHAGQEEPTLRGKSKDEVDATGKKG